MTIVPAALAFAARLEVSQSSIIMWMGVTNMRLSVILTIALSLVFVGIEQSSAVAQILPGVAPVCGGCGSHYDGYRPFRILPRCRGFRCRRPRCACRRMLAAPVACAPACITPRRVVNWQMVPTTVYRRQAYYEQVPVTVYRNVVRYRTVPQQVMVPRRTVTRAWQPRPFQHFAPQMPAYNPGCSECGSSFGTPFSHTLPGQQNFNYPQGGITYPGNVSPGTTTPQPSTVPNVPQMGTPTPHGQQKVPTPVQDPGFKPVVKPKGQSSFTPWQRAPLHGSQYFEESVSTQGYRTLPSIPQTATRQSMFVPASTKPAVQHTFR